MADTEPELVWEGETPLGAKIRLATVPHLGNGLMFSTRMTDPDDPRWFSVYLDIDNVSAIGGTLVGFSLRRLIESLGGGNTDD